ncbi:YggS family pyridoxal phosphate-dependent enzyme [Idiomarina xiamenensis]|uniref:Pyridoxal phosphate homeostasis protein n=1 Tax=Idiomarina xiamenensis 10-D-4 TaxID=740709 RepID=K2K7T9_9GAMM|nr:YggS family pyridoxal phosphate-dependent enzyme [Idiomarina xiamenensis]EKE83723.1 alanine racemase domain-containing protein [Idiomarina xiamenensis 10-D-4]
MSNKIADNLTQVRAEIRQAAAAAQRDAADINLVAVSKTKPADAIEQAYAAGQRAFGENYVQEGVAKVQQLQTVCSDIVWHFIGPIQSNKSRDVAEHFDWVQSIDRDKIAKRLNQQRPSHLPPLQVLIQVNIDDESSKSGVQPEQLIGLAQFIVEHCDRLCLRGIMAIPSKHADEHSYSAMRTLFSALATQYDQVDTLSMGMSQDLQQAIAGGATMVRIGSAIFGAR